ncbi:hypothetical protein J6590_047977 [Homalodisca vitripennis]|nr:hypothetical protein J6590_047977 [Homalodisca vitripennis]
MLYAMSYDGLLIASFAKVSVKRQTPVIATMFGGAVAGIMAAVFNLDQLIDMMSIGTLLAYTIVAICVLVLRYRDPNPVMYEVPMVERSNGNSARPEIQASTISSLKDIFNLSMMKYPSRTSEMISYWALASYIVLSAVFCITLVNVEDFLANGTVWAITVVSVLALCMVIILLILHRQPQAQENLNFKVPLLPLIPCLSICINLYLMAKLDIHTWIRFGIWLFVGMLIYIFYSIPNSMEGIKAKQAKAESKSQNKSSTRENAKI